MPSPATESTPDGDGFVRVGAARIAARVQRARAAMESERLDALVVAGRGVISHYGYLEYVTGYCPVVREAYAVIAGGEPPALVLPTAADAWYARRATGLSDIRVAGQGDVMSSYDDLPGGVAAVLCERGAERGRIGIVGLHQIVPHGQQTRLRQALPSAELLDATALLAEVKAIKDEDDLRELRRTAEVAELGLQVGIEQLRAGCLPREVGAAMEQAVRARGAREVLIFLSAHPYFLARPDALALSEGDLVTAYVEMTGPTGYWVECGALAALGELDAEPAALARSCLDAAAAAQRQLRAGRRAADVARAIDEEAAAAEARVGIWHGHGVGIDHDLPVITAADETELRAGMAISVHPNFSTVDERLGASVACTSIVGAGDPEPLTRIQLELHRR